MDMKALMILHTSSQEIKENAITNSHADFVLSRFAAQMIGSRKATWCYNAYLVIAHLSEERHIVKKYGKKCCR